jgi:hypothetical protein
MEMSEVPYLHRIGGDDRVSATPAPTEAVVSVENIQYLA